jgi:alpha-beta hydrolase superfamily lysophospholipase
MEPSRTTTIDVDGGALYAEAFLPKGPPRGIVVVTHGYAEHCGRHRELAHVIVNAGWAALTYDIRGHGKSFGPRGYVDHFSRYLDDLSRALATARTLAPGAPAVLLGHSHGGLVTLRALCDGRPPDVVCAIVSSPWLATRRPVPAYQKLLARVASRVVPKLAQPNGLKKDVLSHDAAKEQERLADKLCHDVATARWFTEAMAAQAYVRDHAQRIPVPTTWLVGADDTLADPAESRRIASVVGSASYHEFPGLLHEVFNEVDRARVFSELTRALTACATPAKA